jgi:DNA-binding NtrC family response regulator
MTALSPQPGRAGADATQPAAPGEPAPRASGDSARRASGATVILIEDDPVLARSIGQRLRLEGVTAYWARTVAEGEAMLRRHRPTLLVCDMRLPDGSGEALLARLMPELGGVPVVAVTAYGGVEQAVRLMRIGVDDYLTKPFPMQRLLDKLAAFAAARPAAQPAASAEPPPTGWTSLPMRALAETLRRVAAADAPVLLTGESGAGKSLAARRLHAIGPRAAHPCVTVDCPSLPASVEASERLLFGEGEGEATVPGLLDQAAAGTLVLDEVADLAAPLQARLLRLIEDRSFLRMGARAPAKLRARIVATSQAGIGQAVTEGSFRPDLWYRLAVLEIPVPSLRERAVDLTELTDALLRALGGDPARLAPEARAALAAHGWPGNVRELRNRLERALLLAAGTRIGPADLFPERLVAPELPQAAAAAEPTAECDAPSVASLAEARDAAEREHIRRVLAHCRGRTREAAGALGVSRTTLWERMRKLGLSSGKD